VGRAKNQRAVLRQVGGKVKSPWTVTKPVALLSALRCRRDVAADQQRHQPPRDETLRLGDDTGRRLQRADLLDADPRPRGALGQPPALALMKLVKEDRTKDIDKSLCTASGLPAR
jgi:hypothetical protein